MNSETFSVNSGFKVKCHLSNPFYINKPFYDYWKSHVKYQFQVHQICLCVGACTFNWLCSDLGNIEQYPPPLTSSFYISWFKLWSWGYTFCIFPGHFRFHQDLSVWQRSVVVWARKKNSIHLLFLSRQLLTFFQSFSLMVFNLVLHTVRCLISDFLTGT